MQGGFPINFYFSHFAVERESGCAIVTFGCLVKGRFLDELFSCAITAESIEFTRQSALDCLGRIGEILPMEIVPLPPAKQVFNANMISMSHRADVAGTPLHNFAFSLTLLDQKESTIAADPVALLRSPLNVQRNLIVALYK